MNNCTITTRDMDGVTIIDITGRMSFPDPHLQEKMALLVEAGCKGFVLNFERVTYVDSYGLHDLVMAFNAVKGAGGKLLLLKPIPNVKKTIEITMKGIFQFFDDEQAAVNAAR
jgi:anti-sigma B factor antagonist